MTPLLFTTNYLGYIFGCILGASIWYKNRQLSQIPENATTRNRFFGHTMTGIALVLILGLCGYSLADFTGRQVFLPASTEKIEQSEKGT